jgi:hypothetical protein
VLVIRNGVQWIGGCTADSLFREVLTHRCTKWWFHSMNQGTQPGKRFMDPYGYDGLTNRKGHYNNCYGEERKDPNPAIKQGTVMAFDETVLVHQLRERLPMATQNPKLEGLAAEGNFYFDIKNGGIGAHGDAERKITIGMRAGESFPLAFCWFKKGKTISQRIDVNLAAGDVYFMSDKATGHDWQEGVKKGNSVGPYLKHAAGRHSKHYTAMRSEEEKAAAKAAAKSKKQGRTGGSSAAAATQAMPAAGTEPEAKDVEPEAKAVEAKNGAEDVVTDVTEDDAAGAVAGNAAVDAAAPVPPTEKVSLIELTPQELTRLQQSNPAMAEITQQEVARIQREHPELSVAIQEGRYLDQQNKELHARHPELQELARRQQAEEQAKKAEEYAYSSLLITTKTRTEANEVLGEMREEDVSANPEALGYVVNLFDSMGSTGGGSGAGAADTVQPMEVEPAAFSGADGAGGGSSSTNTDDAAAPAPGASTSADQEMPDVQASVDLTGFAAPSK